MLQILNEWLDCLDDFSESTGEQAVWYERILDYIEQIEDGAESIDGKRAEVAFIWCIVNFINAIGDELVDNNRWGLQKHINIFFMVFRHMSELTYWEILDIFPVRIAGENFFDGKDIFFDEDISEFTSPSLDGLTLLILCRCGIYFGEETMGTTDFDSEIGDATMKFVSRNSHPVLSWFYATFLYIVESLSQEIQRENGRFD